MKKVDRLFLSGAEQLDPDLMPDWSRFEEIPGFDVPYLREAWVREVLLDAFGEACIDIAAFWKVDMPMSFQAAVSRRKAMYKLGAALLGPQIVKEHLTMPKGEYDTPVELDMYLSGYSVTEDGRVFSHTRGELAQHPNRDGYPSVRLSAHGKRKRFTVHRLVAHVHLPSRPSPRHEVRHLDGDKTNRHASNLCWGTRAENAQDRDRHGRTSRGSHRWNSVFTEDQVRALRERYAAGGTSTRKIARELNVSQSAVQHALGGRNWRNA